MNEIELFKELASKSEEIGRLKATLDFKDFIISGLQAQLGISTATTVNSTCNCKKHETNEVKISTPEIGMTPTSIKSTEVRAETPEVESPKPKRGRPKGSKNSVEKKSEKKKDVEKTILGGSVFKEFVPLEIDNLMSVDNTSAFISRKDESKSHILSAV